MVPFLLCIATLLVILIVFVLVTTPKAEEF